MPTGTRKAMDPPSPHSLDAPRFLLLFAGGWVAAGTFFSIVSGWHELARRFRAESPGRGVTFAFVSANLGWWILPVCYNRCLWVSVGRKGVELSILFLLGFLHPRLLIPWSEIEAVEEDRFLFCGRAIIYIRGFSRDLTLYGCAGEAVARVFSGVESRRRARVPQVAPDEAPGSHGAS